MCRPTILIELTLLLVIASAGCDSSETAGPRTPEVTDLDRSPRENEEAEWATVWLSGALVAPDSGYQQVKSDLEAIRDQFRDEHPEVDSVHFEPRWIPGVEVGFDQVVRNEIREGTYTDWNPLNRSFVLAETDTFPSFPDSYLFLTFEKRLHPARLGDLYMDLRGVTWVGYRTIWGNFATIYPWRSGSMRTYLFRKCDSACEESRYMYFRVNDEGPKYVGSHESGEGPPDWWPEARTGLVNFGHWE